MAVRPEALTQREFDVLIKCVGMTGSMMDGEALSAIRKANAILLKRNLTWEQVLRGQVTVHKTVADTTERVERGMHDDGAEIDMMLKFLLRTVIVGTSFYSFVESVNGQWKRKGWLSDKQVEAVTNAYRRGRRRRYH